MSSWSLNGRDFLSYFLPLSILCLHISLNESPDGFVAVLSSLELVFPLVDGLIRDLEALAVEGEATASMIMG